jgi:hypothetical protein
MEDFTMSIELMNSLLRDFGATIGLPDLAADEGGYCCLAIGERVRISLQYDPEAQDLALFSQLCRIAPETRFEAYEAMLTGNLFWAATRGGTLAIEPSEGCAMLLMKEKLQALDQHRFQALLEAFTEAAENWQDRLAALAEPEPPPPQGAPSEYIRLA